MRDPRTPRHPPEQRRLARPCYARLRPADEGGVNIVIGKRGADRGNPGDGCWQCYAFKRAGEAPPWRG